MDKVINIHLNLFLQKETKHNYSVFLNTVICLFGGLVQATDDYLYKIIYAQLIDIKNNVVKTDILTDYDAINERYNLGGLAIKNFEEDDPLRIILTNIFRGALYYPELPEK